MKIYIYSYKTAVLKQTNPEKFTLIYVDNSQLLSTITEGKIISCLICNLQCCQKHFWSVCQHQHTASLGSEDSHIYSILSSSVCNIHLSYSPS